jgi:hypothetical protein
MTLPLYTNAKTTAELFTPPKTQHSDFVNLIKMPLFPVKNPQNDFVNTVFTSRFHVVYGNFQPPPFGPANTILFCFNGSYNQLFMGGFTQALSKVELGTLSTVTDNSMTWTGGNDGNVSFTRLSDNLWHILVTRNNNTVYSYYVTPIVF